MCVIHAHAVLNAVANEQRIAIALILLVGSFAVIARRQPTKQSRIHPRKPELLRCARNHEARVSASVRSYPARPRFDGSVGWGFGGIRSGYRG
jgi:hypothetical protein